MGGEDQAVSGRAKGTPADPAAEAREAARELNGTVKDARAVIRELRTAQAEAVETVETMLISRVNQRLNEINAHVRESEARIVASIEATSRVIAERHAELLGTSTPEELIRLIADQFIQDLYEDKFIMAVGEYVAAKVRFVPVDRSRK
jgi:hypothetical protein